MQKPKERIAKTIEDSFAFAHAEICKKQFKKGKYKTPASRINCGRKLYRFLVKYKEKLDPAYNHKRMPKEQ